MFGSSYWLKKFFEPITGLEIFMYPDIIDGIFLLDTFQAEFLVTTFVCFKHTHEFLRLVSDLLFVFFNANNVTKIYLHCLDFASWYSLRSFLNLFPVGSLYPCLSRLLTVSIR